MISKWMTAKAQAKAGQTLVEYVISAVVLVGLVSICAVFLYTFREYGGRILNLVASEYP